jgi:hypothetical protein
VFSPVFFSENYSGECSLSKLKILGGDMARPCTQNLALPNFDFAPPSTPIAFIPKPARPLEPTDDGIVKLGDVITSEMPFVMF